VHKNAHPIVAQALERKLQWSKLACNDPNQKEPTLMTDSHLATLGQRLDRLER